MLPSQSLNKLLPEIHAFWSEYRISSLRANLSRAESFGRAAIDKKSKGAVIRWKPIQAARVWKDIKTQGISDSPLIESLLCKQVPLFANSHDLFILIGRRPSLAMSFQIKGAIKCKD